MEVFAISISFLPAFALALLFMASAIASSPSTITTLDPSSTIYQQQLANRGIQELRRQLCSCLLPQIASRS